MHHIILSQKIDTESTYEGDELYYAYHFPARYKSSIHKGDIFIYYQGNRLVKAQRYYFGTGKILGIEKIDEENYVAKLSRCAEFIDKVPIYLPDGNYYEQLGISNGRLRPPWQSSIRSITEAAYNEILRAANGLKPIQGRPMVEELKESLKTSVKNFFLSDDLEASADVHQISGELMQVLNVKKDK